MQRASFLLVLSVSLIFVVLAPACRGERGRPSANDGSTTADGSSPRSDATVGETDGGRPAYDDGGVPLPYPNRRALGVAIPRGLNKVGTDEGEVVYLGPIPPEKVYEFYVRYLETSQVIRAKRGWSFKMGTPRPPGDPTTRVDVVVLKKGRDWSQVVVFDRMGHRDTPAPEGPIRTEEELRAAAHKGVGSVRRPIPGTY